MISQETADEMTSMLLGTFSNGTAVNANVSGYTIAGKTGTTEAEDDPDKNNDQWIVGFTPDVVISTWLGFEKGDKNRNYDGTSGDTVGYVFQSEASGILPYSAGNSFTVADAYATGGKMMAADEVNENQSQNDQEWNEIKEKAQKGLDSFKEKAKEGLDVFGEKAKDALQQFRDRLNNEE